MLQLLQEAGPDVEVTWQPTVLMRKGSDIPAVLLQLVLISEVKAVGAFPTPSYSA